MKKTREHWIDVLRGIAILFVLIDHGFVFFPATRIEFVGWHTYVAVNWFIFLAGFTNANSFAKKKTISLQIILRFYKSRLSIIGAYLFALLIYAIFDIVQKRPLSEILNQSITFSLGPHFYFVEVILALYLLFPLIYFILRRMSVKILQFIFLTALLIVTYKLFRLTNPPWYRMQPLFSNARAYLFPFCAGILYRLYWRSNRLFILGASLAALLLEIYLLYSRGIIAIAIPNIKLVIYAISTCIIVGVLVEKMQAQNSRTGKLLSYLGRHSLFIYLLHFVILYSLANVLSPMLNYLTLGFALFISVVVSIIGEKLYRYVFIRLSKRISLRLLPQK